MDLPLCHLEMFEVRIFMINLIRVSSYRVNFSLLKASFFQWVKLNGNLNTLRCFSVLTVELMFATKLQNYKSEKYKV